MTAWTMRCADRPRRGLLVELTGRVNRDAFLGHAPGTVLLEAAVDVGGGSEPNVSFRTVLFSGMYAFGDFSALGRLALKTDGPTPGPVSFAQATLRKIAQSDARKAGGAE